MKKMIVTLLLTGLVWTVEAQNCGTPGSSAGGGQAVVCGTAFKVNFSNHTSDDIRVFWNYFTNCSDHLIPSMDITGINQYGIPANTIAPIVHQVYQYESTLGGDGPCGPSDCVPPCYMVLEIGGTVATPTNMSFTPGYNGGTYCGWYGSMCVEINRAGPAEWNITFM